MVESHGDGLNGNVLFMSSAGRDGLRISHARRQLDGSASLMTLKASRTKD